MKNIVFSVIAQFGDELKYLDQAIKSGALDGGGVFSRQVQERLSQMLLDRPTLLTSSCTAALEMSALLLKIKPGDEVIMPSFTFVSTANAFVLRGAKIKFVDVRADTMNIDETLIEAAVNASTRAIVVVHYAGVGCEMDKILHIAEKHHLDVVEDAAQALQATYKGRPLGTLGRLATFSFHQTKNVTSGGEGGLLVVNDPQLVEQAEIIRDKGTDRGRFMRGEVDHYGWVELGSSFLAGELQAAHLFSQLLHADEILTKRMANWRAYQQLLGPLQPEHVDLPNVPKECGHNAHIFFIKCADKRERQALILHLREQGISAVFHYVPLHSSKAGLRFGEFVGDDLVTTVDSERLLRLPLHHQLEISDVEAISAAITRWYRSR